MSKKIAALGLLLCLMLSGCSVTGLVVKAVYPDQKERPTSVDESILQSVQEFSAATSAELLSENDGNMLYSPLSLYYALAMTAEGTEGETREEMNELLRVDQTDRFAQNCGDLYRRLYRDQEGHMLRLANSLWLQEDVEFLESYQDQMKTNFYASLYSVDFGAQETADQMGRWVSEQTGGLLEYEYDPDPSKILTLLNTVWLKDAWRTSFGEGNTKAGTFYNQDGTESTVSFMHSQSMGTVWKGEGFMRAALPLVDCGYVAFILPDEGVDLQDLYNGEKKMTELLWGGKAQGAEIEWSVPKIRIESTLELAEYLQEKIPTAFSMIADFSGMLKGTEAYISDVRQKTYLEWDEEGLEAAAYTEVSVNETAAALPGTSVTMNLNRPFLFAIMTENLPVFVGRYDKGVEA